MVLRIEIKYEGKEHSPSMASELVPLEKSMLVDDMAYLEKKKISREELDFYGRLDENLGKCIEEFFKPQATS